MQESILEFQQRQQNDTKAIVEDISATQQAISGLQSSVTRIQSHGDGVSKSLEVLTGGVMNGQKDLEVMSDSLKGIADELKSSNNEHRDALLSLKVSTFYTNEVLISS